MTERKKFAPPNAMTAVTQLKGIVENSEQSG